MWLLESDDDSLGGRRLWLRPGKTYLFGRTAAEPGQHAISHNTISRKHLTINVADVEPGYAHNLSSRSRLTIEDLKTKIGTLVNGQKIKGEKHIVAGDQEEVDIVMGKCPSKFRLKWFPVVFTFSFTKKELQNGPLTTLQDRFEQLDIKLLTEYHAKWTTHVVSKKRNTAKGLQALINGRYIVTESFLDAVVQVADVADAETDSSALEQDFDRYWPNAMEHLPPPGGEPVQHPDATYAPDAGRKDIFEGYTFIFYDQSQYNNLLAPITDGGGKALMEQVNPGETDVDDFIRYVKSVAGEKGLGSFEDGGEGKGVVLVRYVPAKGAHVEWYTDFFTSVSLRLDHRPIEQSEFLEAILIRDASILRRPLEIESPTNTQEPHTARSRRQEAAPQPSAEEDPTATQGVEEVPESQEPASRRPRTRRPVKRRFAGFDDGGDVDMDDARPVPGPESSGALEDEGGLFVSQEPSQPPGDEPSAERTSQRKRPAPPAPEDDLMDGMAPAAARFKRQRLERGETFPSPTPEPGPEASAPAPEKKKPKKEIDILAVAAQNRQQEEERARREEEDLANLPDDVDLAEIRRLNIVEEVEVRQPGSGARTREQDIADGRWDPKWNGMKNFKKFRRRGEAVGRQPARNIVPLAEVKNKEFGVGDDYWLEDEGSQRRKKTGSQPSGIESQNSAPQPTAPPTRVSRVIQSGSDDDDDDEDESSVVIDPARSTTRGGRAATSQTRSSAATQSSRQSSQNKRPAPVPPKELPPKRQRQTRKTVEVPDSEDSDDDLKFRFGKRR